MFFKKARKFYLWLIENNYSIMGITQSQRNPKKSVWFIFVSVSVRQKNYVTSWENRNSVSTSKLIINSARYWINNEIEFYTAFYKGFKPNDCTPTRSCNFFPDIYSSTIIHLRWEQHFPNFYLICYSVQYVMPVLYMIYLIINIYIVTVTIDIL